MTPIAADLKHLGIRIDIIAVLHTWGSNARTRDRKRDALSSVTINWISRQ